MKKLMLLLMLPLFAGCASNVFTAYPEPGEGESGTIVIHLSDAMPNVYVSIDGQLVAEKKHTRRIEIKDVPVGFHQLAVAATSGYRTEAVAYDEAVEVKGGKVRDVLISTPPMSSGYWIQTGLMYLGILAYTAYLACDNCK